MRKYYLFTIIFFSLNSQIFSQEIEFQQSEYPIFPHLSDFNSSNEGEVLLLKSTRQIWNTTSSSWENDSRIEYSYNEQNLLDTVRNNEWISEAWRLNGGRTYIYDQNNRLMWMYNYLPQWYNIARYNYLYSGNNLWRRDTYTYSGGNQWDNDARITYQWNNQNFVTMWMYEYRHWWYGFWCYGYKYEYIYDSNNRLLRIIDYDGDCCPSWYLYGQELYTNDENGNNIEKLAQVWNPTDSTWINDFLYLYEYDNNSSLIKTIYLDSYSDSSKWKNVWRESYTYNLNNSLETVLNEIWSSDGNWENHTLRMISYDIDGNWLVDVTQKWDSSGWVNYFRYLATWDEPVSVKNDQLKIYNYQLSQNYPNPFNPNTKINYQIPTSPLNPSPYQGEGNRERFITLIVYDVLGNEIAILVNEEKPAGSYTVEFDGTGLTSGVYFYILKTGNYFQSRKMILLK